MLQSFSRLYSGPLHLILRNGTLDLLYDVLPVVAHLAPPLVTIAA